MAGRVGGGGGGGGGEAGKGVTKAARLARGRREPPSLPAENYRHVTQQVLNVILRPQARFRAM